MSSRDFYGVVTHTDLNLYLDFLYGNKALLMYSKSCGEFSPQEDEEWSGQVFVWHALSNFEKQKMVAGMRSGKLRFFSLPLDYYVEDAYSLSNEYSSLAGTVLFCRRTYRDGVSASYLPADGSPARDIAFYQGDQRISYTNITHKFMVGKADVISVSIDEGEKTDIDFTGAIRLEKDEIKELMNAGKIPGVPITPTPLVTPLLNSNVVSLPLGTAPALVGPSF